MTALHYACSLACFDVAKLLIERGADVNAKDANNDTPLHACYFDILRSPEEEQDPDFDVEVDTVKLLLEFGASPNAQNNYGKSPLHLAATFGKC